jgi:AraC-like DNA-binding protein
VISGGAQYTIDGETYELSEGDILCLPPGHLRKAKTYPDRLMHCFAVNFKLKNLKGQETQLPFPLISHVGVRDDLIHLYCELVFTWKDHQPSFSMKARAQFLLVLHRMFELIMYKNANSNVADFRIRKVIRYIEDHYPEKLSVKKLAAMINLNPIYLEVIFKQATGITPYQYLIKTRIRIAQNMLHSGQYNVTDTALHCGYSTSSHFNKQFKQVYGLSPSECIPEKK